MAKEGLGEIMQIRTFTILAIVSLLVATVCISDTSTSAASNPPQMNSLIPRNVQVWKSAELEHPDLVDISLDGKYVVAGDSEFNEVSLLDETGKTLWGFALPPQLAAPRIRWMHISDDGKYVAFGGSYGYIRRQTSPMLEETRLQTQSR